MKHSAYKSGLVVKKYNRRCDEALQSKIADCVGASQGIPTTWAPLGKDAVTLSESYMNTMSFYNFSLLINNKINSLAFITIIKQYTKILILQILIIQFF